MTGWIIFFIIAGLIVIMSTFKKVLNPQNIFEWEKGVVFHDGKFVEIAEAGKYYLGPFQTVQKIDVRTIDLDVPPQNLITKDNITIQVNAVVYFKVVDPRNALCNVQNYIAATRQLARAGIRNILGQYKLNEILANREKINESLKIIMDKESALWGLEISSVETKDVVVPESMQKMMAKEAEAEREKVAKIIHAEGEFQAAKTLTEAAALLEKNPIAMQLRYFQTLKDLGQSPSSTIFCPLPSDLIKKLM